MTAIDTYGPQFCNFLMINPELPYIKEIQGLEGEPPPLANSIEILWFYGSTHWVAEVYAIELKDREKS
ncbi:MAG: hypothetical protein KDD45_10785 [Bdellovibrionales bacterium]|nr:hypothetical protein [Bdellovibrionales bacterium]